MIQHMQRTIRVVAMVTTAVVIVVVVVVFGDSVGAGRWVAALAALMYCHIKNMCEKECSVEQEKQQQNKHREANEETKKTHTAAMIHSISNCLGMTVTTIPSASPSSSGGCACCTREEGAAFHFPTIHFAWFLNRLILPRTRYGGERREE